MIRTMLTFLLLAPMAFGQTVEQRVDFLETLHGLRAMCGNGMLNPSVGEQCDDGNAVAGDGCSATCQIEPPPQVCGNGAREGTEECDGLDLVGQTCVSKGFDSGTLACSSACLFDTSACVTGPPPPSSVYSQLLANLPPPGEFKKLPGSDIGTTLVQNGEFPFCADIKCFTSSSAFTAWVGMAFNRVEGQWWNLAGGGHADYGGNEIYRYNFPDLSWTRVTQPQPLVAPPLAGCNVNNTPASGPSADHTYDGSIYIPTTNQILVFTTAPFCASGSSNGSGFWVYDIAPAIWTKHSEFTNTGYPKTVWDAARQRVYLIANNNGASNTLYEVNPAANYSVTLKTSFGWISDGPAAWNEATRELYFAGSGGVDRVTISLTGTVGVDSRIISWSSDTAGVILRGFEIHEPTGHLVFWRGDNRVWRYNPTTDVMTLTTVATGEQPPVMSQNIYSKWIYVSECDCFIGISDARQGVWVYRTSDSVVLTPPPVVGSFEARCAADGVVFCDPLDTEAPEAMGVEALNPNGTTGIPTETWWRNWRGVSNAQLGEPRFRLPSVDTQMKASGSGSLRFEYPTRSGEGGGGLFTTNFSPDFSVQFGEGDTFHVQYRLRYSCDFVYRDCEPASPAYKTARRWYRTPSGGWTAAKSTIISTGDRVAGESADACTFLEIVLNHGTDHSLQGYQSCLWYSGFDETGANIGGSLQIEFQPGSDFDCWWMPKPPSSTKRSWGNSGPNCFQVDADEWMTFQVRLQIGQWQSDRSGPKLSRFTLWAAHEDEPQQIVIDLPVYLQAPEVAGEKYGKIWLLPFMTAKDPTEEHPTGHVWYDELIVSQKFIGDP